MAQILTNSRICAEGHLPICQDTGTSILNWMGRVWRINASPKCWRAAIKLPDGVDFTDCFIYYVGSVDPLRDEAVGPAGPTTATRMDRYTEMMLAQMGMVGKAERGSDAIQSIKNHGAVYLIAIGGAAYWVSKAIRGAKVLAFADLGMEAIYEFEVEDMPVTVAVDTQGRVVHDIVPAEWKKRIGMILLKPI